MQCTFTKKDSTQCNARSLKDTKFCFRHDTASALKAVQASRTGGMNRSRSISFPEQITLKTTSDLQALIGKTINGVWQGKVPTKVGSSIGFLARCWLDAYEKAEIEKRVAALEDQMTKLA